MRHMTYGVSDTEARAALDAIERGRRHVIDEIDLPRWYWWGLAVGWIGLGVVTDLQHPWLTVAATIAFGAVHASVSHVVVGGRRRTTQLSVHTDVVGPHVPLLVIGSLIGLAGLTVVGGVAAYADDARHPVTIASIFVAVVIVLGGPRLMGLIRQRAAHPSTMR